ncbi:MAG: putative selenate reductase subunit YgfK [Treponema sp.]|nr:putative selenate reductase subunit YgfK [Treponema sp.]
MLPIPFADLLHHILEEYKKEKSIFGITKFYKADKNKTYTIFGEKLETPFGPAAGPHTQLAQNIVSAYLCGSRFFELKTVQKIDGEDLPVSKPCILSGDEGYNCEWSTELTVPQAYEEYVKGWFCLKILSKELGLGSVDGFVFNMSVGYDLAGIKLPKINKYIEGMCDASSEAIFAECKKVCAEAVSQGCFKQVTQADIDAITPRISHSITISTLHGCPPSEIESMAMYLLTEKKLHTFIKCNPTLLGYEYARKTLDGLGFDYIAFDDHHFVTDLQYSDAVPMLQRLQKTANDLQLQFGVKITNTFPVDVTANELPSEEMYMSGRSLAPLSLSVARKLSGDFKGTLRISYSGGADVSNITSIIDTGIWPVTMATTMLKPGGYERMTQIAQKCAAMDYKPFTGISVDGLNDLTEKICSGAIGNRKALKPAAPYKSHEKLPLTDCFMAPCKDTCPIHQDIPAYLRLNAAGDYVQALRVITDKNPLPFITGTICAHTCMGRCTRNFYDSSVAIRKEKLVAAEKAYDTIIKELRPGAQTTQKKVAVIGGGPAGISAAYLLGREGIPVTVFEKRDTCGGIVRHVIPAFRISDEAIEKDISLAKAVGATFVTGTEITSVKDLFAKGFTDVIVAVGAWKPAHLTVAGATVVDALEFLEDCKKHPESVAKKYGENIVVIGGGNTAMDTARAAKRISSIKEVHLVYRRTKRYMPADEEELQLALEDGVDFKELRAPVSYAQGALVCDVMRLGEPDASGRRSPEKTGQTESVPCTCIVAATGENLDDTFFAANNITVDERGKPVVDAMMQTKVPHVFVVGDAASGPATVVKGIAGATAAAQAITALHIDHFEALDTNDCVGVPLAKHGLVGVRKSEGERCLECRTICENCVDVCPNRANVAIKVGKKIQILHVDGMCNECGNCAQFCPYSGRPYKDKFTLFNSYADMDASENPGFALDTQDKSDMPAVRIRFNGKVYEHVNLHAAVADIPDDIVALMKTVISDYRYLCY